MAVGSISVLVQVKAGRGIDRVHAIAKRTDVRSNDIDMDQVIITSLALGLYSLSGRTSYRKISRSLESSKFWFQLFPMVLKFDSAAEMHVKFQSDTIIMTPNLALWCGCLTCCRTFWQYSSALGILRTRWIEIGCYYTLMLSTGCVGSCVFFLLLLFFWEKKTPFLFRRLELKTMIRPSLV